MNGVRRAFALLQASLLPARLRVSWGGAIGARASATALPRRCAVASTSGRLCFVHEGPCVVGVGLLNLGKWDVAGARMVDAAALPPTLRRALLDCGVVRPLGSCLRRRGVRLCGGKAQRALLWEGWARDWLRSRYLGEGAHVHGLDDPWRALSFPVEAMCAERLAGPSSNSHFPVSRCLFLC